LRNRWVMGLALAVTALGKQNGWAAVLPFVLLSLWSTRTCAGRERWQVWLAICLLPSLTGGSWLVRNRVLYGDWMALKVQIAAWQDFMTRLGLSWGSLSSRGSGLGDLLTKTPWAQWTFESFWGRFFYMNVLLPPAIYTTLAIGCALGLLTTLRAIVHSLARNDNLFSQPLAGRILKCASAAFVVLLASNIWTNIYNDFQPQGRYFFPLLVPIGILLTLGLFKLQMTRPRAAGAIWGIVLAILVTLNVFSLYIIYTHPYPQIPLPDL
jgi:hypothetical protein